MSQNAPKIDVSVIYRKGLSPEVLAEVEELRKERYSQMQRFGKKKGKDLPFPDIDPHSILNVMKPVDPEVTKILYTRNFKFNLQRSRT